MLILLSALIAIIIGTSWVQGNRGQILETPEWRLYPQLAKHGLLFFASFLYSWCTLMSSCIFFANHLPVLTGISILLLIICPFLLILQHLHHKKQSCNPPVIQEEIQIHSAKYHKDLVGYLEYTIIYSAECYIIIFMIEFIVFYLLSQEKNIHSMTQVILSHWQNIRTGYLITILGFSLVGEIAVLHRGIDNSTYTSEKMQRNRIMQNKEYLDANSTKN